MSKYAAQRGKFFAIQAFRTRLEAEGNKADGAEKVLAERAE